MSAVDVAPATTASGRSSSASRCTASWPPPPSCSAAAPTSSATSPTPTSCPVCLGLPGSLPVLNRRAVELAMRLGRALHCDGRAVGVRPEELLLPGHAEGLPGQPVRPADQRRRLARAARRHARRHRAGPHRGGHRQDRPTSGGGGRIHGADYSLDRLQPGRRPAASRSSAGPTSARPSRPGPTSTSCAPSSLATGVSRRQDGGGLDAGRRQRVGAPGRRRRAAAPAARSRTSTRCGRSAGPSSTRPRRQIDLLEAGERVDAGDPPLGRGGGPHPLGPVARRRPTTTATSRSPTSCPSSPIRPWHRRDRRRPAGAAGGPPRPPGRARPASARRAAVALLVHRGLDDLALAAIDAGGDPARVLTHVEHNLAVDGAGRSTPTAFAALVDHGGRRASSPPPRPRRCSPTWSRPGGDPAAIAAERGFEAMDTSASSRPSSTASSPPTPTTGPTFVRRRRQAPGSSRASSWARS